jgi:hypothetical protein
MNLTRMSATIVLADAKSHASRGHRHRPRIFYRARIPLWLEDRIAGLPHPPPPSPLRICAATTSPPSVQPLEAPSSSSHAHSPTLRGNLLSPSAVPTPAVPAPSNPPPPLHQSYVPGSSSRVLPLGYPYPQPMTSSRLGTSSIIPSGLAAADAESASSRVMISWAGSSLIYSQVFLDCLTPMLYAAQSSWPERMQGGTRRAAHGHAGAHCP